MQYSAVHIVALFAVFQSVFLSVFFFTNKKGDKTGNRLFGMLLIVFAATIAHSFTQSTGMIEYFRSYFTSLYFISQLSFLISPLLYLYIKSILIPGTTINKRDLIVALPFGIAIILILLFRFILPFDLLPFRYFHLGLGSLLFLQDALYIYLIIKILKEYNIRLKDLFAAGDSKISLLRLFIVGFILVWNFKLNGFIVFNVEELWGFCPHTEALYLLGVFIFLNLIVFTALKKPELFSTIKKYESSELTADDRNRFLGIILKKVEKEKLYLDPRLTLPELSKITAIPVRYISQVINEELNKNFNDFINGYRISEFKKILSQNEENTKNILEIAYQSGFNSKSSFYDAFKKETGLTPSQYKSGLSNN